MSSGLCGFSFKDPAQGGLYAWVFDQRCEARPGHDGAHIVYAKSAELVDGIWTHTQHAHPREAK